MPRVPVAQQTVAPQLIQAPQARSSDFSGFQQLAKGVGQLADVQEEVVKKEQQARVAEAENNLHTDLLDIDARFKQLKGKQAFDGRQAYEDEIAGAIERHRSGLNSKFQDRIYTELAGRHQRKAKTIGSAHALQQLEKYNIEQRGARVSLLKQDSLANPVSAIQNQKDIDGEVEDLLVGSSPEKIAEEKLKQSSSHYKGILDQLLAEDKLADAKVYYKAWNKHYGDTPYMTAEDKSQFEVALQEATQQQEIAKAVGEIYDPNSDDLAGMLDAGYERFMTGENVDIDAFIKFNQLVGLRMQAQEKTEQKQRDAMRNDLFDQIAKGDFTTANFTAEQLKLLDDNDQWLLERYEEMWTIKSKETGGIQAVTEWYSLSLDDMKDAEKLMTEYLPRMTEKQQTVVINEWRRLMVGGAKTAEAGVTQSKAESLKRMYQIAGIDGTSRARKQKQEVMATQYENALDRFVRDNGKNPSLEQQKAIQNQVLMEVPIYEGYKVKESSLPFTDDPTVRAFQFEIPTDGDGNPLMSEEDTQKAREYIRAQEQERKMFVPMTPYNLWRAHLEVRKEEKRNTETNNLNINATGQVGDSQSGFDGDPLDAFRDSTTGQAFRQLNVNSYDELVAMAESEIPTEETQRAIEMLTEVDRKIKMEQLMEQGEEIQAVEMMTPEELNRYVRSLTISQRSDLIIRLKSGTNAERSALARKVQKAV
jgi:hypothetical protein